MIPALLALPSKVLTAASISAAVRSGSLILAIVGSVGFGFIYACFARIDEVVIAKGELQALGAERPIRSPISGIVESFKKIGDPVISSPIINNGNLYILTKNSRILGFN